MGIIKKPSAIDEQLLVELIEMHKEQFYRIAYSYVKNEHDALDVIQDSVYKAYISMDQLKSRKYFKTWFTRILINKAIDHIRANRKVITIDAATEDYIYDRQPDLSDHEQLEMSLDLKQMLDTLTPHEQSVILMRFYMEYPLGEIARITDNPLSSIKSTLYRSLGKLRKVMNEGEKS